MTKLKLLFSDFSSDFNPKNDYFYKILSRKYQIVMDAEHPDWLIYSAYSNDFLNYNCVRIFYTAENIRPDYNLCDYALGFDYMDFGDRYMRLPNFARYGKQFESLIRERTFSPPDLGQKRAFCNFIYSNAIADPMRDRFFHFLSNYKRVDSLGIHLNNINGKGADRNTSVWRSSKVEMQKPYKFSIAFENSSSPGYTTEKILHAFIADTVPIYWGNPLIAREFNPRSFINCHDFESMEAVVQRVVELDQDDAQFLAMLNEPCFPGNVIPAELREDRVLDFFSNIFSQSPCAARRRPAYGTTAMYEQAIRAGVRAAAQKARLMHALKLPARVFRKLAAR